MFRIKPVLCALLVALFTITFTVSVSAHQITAQDAQERVETGASYLDTHNPGWDNRIEVSSLDIQHANRCVLGQLYGNFTRGRIVLKLSEDMSLQNGFSTEIGYKENERLLTVAWRKLIKKRRATDN